VTAAELPNTPLAAGTVVTASYLPWVRVTASSFSHHHPDALFAVLVIDEPTADQLREDDSFVILRPTDVGLTESEFGWMDLIYSPLELSCALKPWLVRRLLETADVAIYLDADICVYDSLSEFAAQAADVGLVLSPHALAPRTEPNVPGEEDLFVYGQYNGGLLAASKAARPFVDWWASKCARECQDLSAERPTRYLDQRWLDLAIGYFPSTVNRDPGVNLARWNLAQRELELVDGEYRVDGAPLRCFHFSAFDPAEPEELSYYHHAHPKANPAESLPLRTLLADYMQRLLAAGWQPKTGSGHARVLGGIELTPIVRSAIRAALIDAEQIGVAPSNVATDPGRLIAWLRAPVSAGGLSWYLWGLRSAHAGVRATFPQAPGPDEPRYLAWSAAEGISAGLVPSVLAGPAAHFSLNGARGLVTLLEIDEILADPSLLEGLSDVFTRDDDVTLLLRAPGHDPQTLVPTLTSLLSRFGLDGPTAPDLLAVLDPVPPQLLAPHVNAILTRRQPDPAFANASVYSSARAMRPQS
jgi:hypothetical protein